MAERLSRPNVVYGLAALSVLTIVLVGSYLLQVLVGLPGRDQLRQLGEPIEATNVFDAGGRFIFSIPAQYRLEVPLERISPHMRNAIVAAEDIRFYDHDGIDAVRVIGAALINLRKTRAAEGASTITQQLARVSFLTPDKTLRRKVREAVLAQRIEHLYSKEDILEMYLNKVYFGDGLYGAEAAARGYFGKPAAELTLGEAAMLAGLVKAPSTTSPTISVGRAIERRNIVLKLMHRYRLIDERAYESAIAETVILRDDLRHDDPMGRDFKEVVRRQLVDMFGKSAVYSRGLRVYTTLDPAMQKAAEAAVAQTLREIEARIRPRTREPLQGALFALDPATGEVRAMVGGRDAAGGGLNRALQAKRQPGSAFKPFVYAAALESGYSPASLIGDLNRPIDTHEGEWLPEDDHSNAASMTLRAALRTSSNRAAVRTLEEVGIGRVVAYAMRLGVGSVPSVPSLALGSGEVTLASMTAAYAAFADGGVIREPVCIRRVEDQEGNVIFSGDARPRRAMSEATAFLMANMLAEVVDAGTANRARRLGFALPAAGKTGTTNDFVDAWFIGFTPRLAAGVWVGFDQPRTIVKDGFAGQLAVPLWTRFMKAATRHDPKAWIKPPEDVVAIDVCRRSGLLAGPDCRHAMSIGEMGDVTYGSTAYREYFVRGREPRQICAAHAEDYLLLEAVPAALPLFPEEAEAVPAAP